MKDVILYNKPLGFTPLQAIDQLKQEHPEFAEVPITYAGRLDPMAQGLLLLLSGNAIAHKQEFLNLPKTYKAQILFGFETDSYDVLGLPKYTTPPPTQRETLEKTIQNFIGTQQLPYPPFSSQPVNGKPLWQWAKENRLSEIQIPTREMNVISAEVSSIETIPWKEIYTTIRINIGLVSGDFRQLEILQQWEQINAQINPAQQFQIANITFTVSSGTYIRTLAHELGKKLGTTALLYSLNRTGIGKFTTK